MTWLMSPCSHLRMGSYKSFHKEEQENGSYQELKSWGNGETLARALSFQL